MTERRWKDSAAALSQQRNEAGGRLIRGTPVMLVSSPDNDGTGQYYRMARVRQARREGGREEPALSRPLSFPPARNPVDMGWIAVRTQSAHHGTGNSWAGIEVAGREATVKVCGVVVAMPQGYSWPPRPAIG